MRLFELAENPIVTKLVAITDQLKTDLEQENILPNMSTEDFLQYLQEYDINVDINDLYNMVKKPPLDKLISNIKDGEVIFKGFSEETNPEQDKDKNEKIVQKMAKSAQTKL
jgi:hypothetical protein